MSEIVLAVEQLKTHFFTRAGVVKSVDGLDLTVHAGEILGLVGESGSGKSVTGFSILKLIDAPGKIVGGSIRFAGQALEHYSEAQMQKMRGADIAMVFQDPMMTLNPVLKIRKQMLESLQVHQPQLSKTQMLDRCIEVLEQVGIPSPVERLEAYPHELSGGMRQRIAIAIALLNRPKLIIADEPTTALDVTIQSQILSEMQKLCQQSGTAIIWITHDLAVVSGLADHIAVMYAGRIVEYGTTAQVLEHTQHPYTDGVMRSIPSPHTRGQELYQIPGMTPSLLALPEGCAFRPRCSFASDACTMAPPTHTFDVPQRVSCWHPLQENQHAH